MTDIKKAAALLDEVRQRIAVALSKCPSQTAASAEEWSECVAIMRVIARDSSEQLEPLLRKLEARASLPEDRRLLNEKTCEAVHAMVAEFVGDVQPRVELFLRRAETQLESATARAAAKLLAKQQHDARCALEEGPEASARSAVEREEATALGRIHASFARKVAVVKRAAKRAARDDAKQPQPSRAMGSSKEAARSIESRAGLAKALKSVEAGVTLLTDFEAAMSEVVDAMEESFGAIEADESDTWTEILAAARNDVCCAFASDASVRHVDVTAGGVVIAPKRRWIANVLTAEPAIFSVASQWLVKTVVGPRITVARIADDPDARQDEAVDLYNVGFELVFRCAVPVVGSIAVVPEDTAATLISPLALARDTGSTKPTVAVVLAHGGYFAAGVFSALAPSKPLLHKTFARYVTRRGQGGRQSAHSGRTDTAGSQLRAAMEKKWTEECTALLNSWRADGVLAACDRVLVHAPGAQNHAMLLGKGAPLSSASATDDAAVTAPRDNSKRYRAVQQQLRVATLPIASGRPTLTEAQRCLQVLLSATVVVL